MFHQIISNGSQLVPIACLLLATIGICSFWCLFKSSEFKEACLRKAPDEDGIILHMILLKYTGFFIMGLLPYVIFMKIAPEYDWKSMGFIISSRVLLATLAWVAAICVPMLWLLRYTANKPVNYKQYPHIRVAAWDLNLIVRYSLAWTVYLLGYEMLYRGLLLFPLVDSIGVWPAIVISSCIYAIAHLPKGPLETFASLIFGPLFCYITLQTHAIWATWIIHSVLAIANSVLAIKYHPSFFFVKNRKPTVTECDI